MEWWGWKNPSFSSDNAMKDGLGSALHFHLDLELKGGKVRTRPRYWGAQEEGRAEGETGLVAISNTGLLIVEL